MRSVANVVVLAVCALACPAFAVPASADPDGGGDPSGPIEHLGDRFVPKAPGTVEELKLYFGPYLVPPGHDMNRVDLDVPLRNGFALSIEPGMRRVADGSEPIHQEAHIHHAHWFGVDPGNPEDNYTYGNTEWIFGNGDEETKANFQERSAADPHGPVYGEYIDAPQIMIYMLHNKTSEPLLTYIVLDVTFAHGSPEQLQQATGRPWHDVSGVLFGRTYNVPRQPNGDGIYETTRDQPKPIEWTSTLDGTIIGTGGHLHPGGKTVVVENYGSKDNPCPDDRKGYGGTTLLRSDALFRNAMYSEDFQMEVSDPSWRAPIHKGDRIRLTGIYENKDHAWYSVMTHEGLYIDEAQPPQGRCAPKLIGNHPPKVTYVEHRHRHLVRNRAGKLRTHVHLRRHIHHLRGGKVRVHIHQVPHVWIHRHRVEQPADPSEGVPNRPWGPKPDPFCGEAFGAPACERPLSAAQESARGQETNQVTISNFVYSPGDRTLSGADGAPVRVKHGTSLTFVNADQAANIRHTVTTCEWPCNGRYVANYPFDDGRWDSGTLGYDAVDGGNPNPTSSTPPNLPVGKYAYFCRIHPWMRGAFEIVP